MPSQLDFNKPAKSALVRGGNWGGSGAPLLEIQKKNSMWKVIGVNSPPH